MTAGKKKKEFLELVDALLLCVVADGTAKRIEAARPEGKQERLGFDKGYDPKIKAHRIRAGRRRGNDAYRRAAKEAGFVTLWLGPCKIDVRYTPRSLTALYKEAARLPSKLFL
ncbi:MAG: hypothetical protein KDA41_09875 [Planctomycetales bacterium]|nr:hypothetical protein [Planctomycetales bacterium]